LFLLPTFVSGTIFHEHRAYCAFVGIIFMVSKFPAVSPITVAKKLHVTLAGAILAGLAIVSIVHSEKFRDRTAYAMSAYLSDPSVDASYAALAGMFMDEGDDVRAEEVLRRGLERIPSMTKAHRLLADIYAKRRDFARASREYEIALHLDPFQLYTYIGYGKMYLDMGLPDKAIRLWKTAVTVEPNFILGYYYLANAYVRIKNDPDSAMIYVREIQRHGDTVMPELLSAIKVAAEQRTGKR
jgi:tetratricopeptide (TPR) repeat protein